VQYPPGFAPPPHIHDHEDEAFYVLDGDVELQIGDEVSRIAAGTFAFVPRGTVHRFSCVGERPGRMLIAFTPGGLDQFFRESGRPAVDDGPAPPVDEDEIARTEVSARRHGLRVVAWS
jgi:quercetin dioxygenase-like cupin family protein